MTASAGAARYLYGIVAAGHPLPPGARGVGTPPAPVELLTAGPVSAVVGDAPARLRARRRDLLAHQELLLALADDGPVLPMRFGMVAPDAAAVRAQLEAGRERYPEALRRVAGRVEMNVKAEPATDALAELVAGDPRIRRLREEARRRPGYEANLRLGEAVSHALASRAAAAAREAVRELEPPAAAVTTGPQVASCVLNVSFLVAREDVAGFRAAAERLAAAYRDRAVLRVAGPLPCYSFTEPEPVGAARAGS